MDYEWDELKNLINQRKHGISFEEAIEIFDGPIMSRVDDRYDYEELREISIGRIGHTVVIVVVHTDRDDLIRIISARRAKSKESLRYYEHIQKTLN